MTEHQPDDDIMRPRDTTIYDYTGQVIDTGRIIPDAALKLGQATTVPDGTWYAVAVWSCEARAYIDDPALGLHARNVDSLSDSLPVGSRLVRYHVHQGFVTTRCGMGK